MILFSSGVLISILVLTLSNFSLPIVAIFLEVVSKVLGALGALGALRVVRVLRVLGVLGLLGVLGHSGY